ncbi:MAG TPA: DUF6491 family protein [Steroidobacteraceae bacterium]|jgi:hypothetical protein|nr:DUF6491 family protein [Steroidobacteraceae bacterium]
MKRAKIARLFVLGALVPAALCAALAADNPPPSAASSAAAVPPPAPEAQIPFAKKNIWNWQVVDDKTVLIQDQGRQWYKATLFGNCINLSFAQRLAFDSNPSGTFDKFSAILARGQRCPLVSLVKTSAPPKKAKAKKPDPAAAP